LGHLRGQLKVHAHGKKSMPYARPKSKIACGFASLIVFALFAVSPSKAQLARGSLHGTVVDNSGATVQNAKVILFNKNTGQTFEAVTNTEGFFGFNEISPGEYALTVAVPGFKEQRLDSVNVAVAQANNLQIVLSVGEDHGVTLPAHRTFTDPVWNVWEERFSSVPTYQPVIPLINKDYSLVVNLSALVLNEFEKAVYSRSTSSAISDWLEKNKAVDSVDVDVLVLPDRKYFAVQMENERIKSLHIDLAKMRSIQKNGFDISDSPFATLRANKGDAPFSFGTQTFRIRTGSQTGNGFVALSIWVDGKPLDELSMGVCILARQSDSCGPMPAFESTFRGNDLSGKGTYPDAALHLIDRQSDIVGVYRCNTCGWAANDYRTWQIEQSAKWFSDRTKEVLDLMTQPPNAASHVTISQQFEQAGENMRNVIFDPQDTDAAAVAATFADFVFAARTKKQNKEQAPTLFVRFITSKPDLILAPVNLMRMELSDHSKEFIGLALNIQSPLEFQDYSKATSCISQWTLFVPPDKVPPPPSLQAVLDARAQFDGWITTFQNNCHDCVKDDENKFQTWLAGNGPPQSEAVALLSHHSTNSVFFYDGGSPAIQSSSMTRSFAAPSLAIIDGCGTSEPGASEFIRAFNAHGISSVIATSTEVDPVMAGQFLASFMDLLRAHVGDSSYTVSRARFDAVTALYSAKDQSGNAYGPRALAFILAGNGSVRACVPADQKAQQSGRN
jgi:hypothetical protein